MLVPDPDHETIGVDGHSVTVAEVCGDLFVGVSPLGGKYHRFRQTER